MNTGWSPKPLRNVEQHFTELPIVVKGLTPMQRQRELDGTPHTRTGPTALRAPDPVLVLPATLKKGSLVEKFDERPKAPKQEPEDPMTVVKSYLAGQPAQPDANMAKSVSKMNAAIQDVLAKTGAK